MGISEVSELHKKYENSRNLKGGKTDTQNQKQTEIQQEWATQTLESGAGGACRRQCKGLIGVFTAMKEFTHQLGEREVDTRR